MTSPKTWIRLYCDVHNNPKVQRLQPELFKFWVNVLSVAGTRPGGILPAPDELSWILRVDAGVCSRSLSDLVSARLLIRVGSAYKPYDWDDRQYESDTSNGRTKEWRKRRRDASVTSHVTPSEQSRADTEQSRTEQSAQPRRASAATAATPPQEAPSAKTNPRPEPPGYHTDELYSRFRAEYRDWAPHVLEEDFQRVAWHKWKILDGEQKLARLTALSEMTRTRDPAFAPAPANFIETEWKRPPRPAAKPTLTGFHAVMAARMAQND